MERDPRDLSELEDGIVRLGLEMIREHGPAGLLAFERANRRVMEAPSPGSLRVSPPPEGPFIPYRPARRAG